ncbi:hypothetical protein FYK55_24865 [Roseiconus nitratireducens]|uniref:Uncharacterized protein n=1 Tax=Roseiconus nitratireducens TaxID=2605748 RepID=A0A5M6D141_9BACT|nr:hypothetical protein [Roseiconus nitratireducens]KAA5539339.1 hypothetical protein FYK55_24865 [Roseiconus nitratireducens]
MIHRFLCCLAVLAAVLPATRGFAEDEKLALLLDRTPAPPNVVGYVNVKSLNSLMSDAGFSREIAGSLDEYWFISKLELMSLKPRWEAGYATLQRAVDAKMLADKVGGYVDQIEGKDVVWTPNQSYLVPGEENRVGILRPADRSLLSGWLSPTLNSSHSEYLETQAKQSENYLSMMFAVDLADAFSPVPMAKKLEGFESLKSQQPETVAGILASIKGARIIIGRRSLDECILTVDFGKSPAGLKPIAADLLGEILSRNGTAAPEVLSWKVSVKDNQMALQGTITEATLSGLMGVFSLQGQARQVGRKLSDDAGSESQKVAYQTKNYFDEVNAIIERTRKHSAQTTGALAKWNDQRARQIDELGTLGVDPEMVQYGTNVAELLRGNALAVRQTNIQAGKINASQSLNSGYYGNGYYDANSTTDYQQVTQAYARGNAYANYKGALNQIDKMTAETRRAMTDKYQIQF